MNVEQQRALALARARLRTKISTSEDVQRSLASGWARSIPKTLDTIGGAGAEAINLGVKAVGGEGAPFGDIYNSSNTFNDAASRLLGPEYQPRTGMGSTAKLGAEILSPWGMLSGLKAGAGFVRGLAGMAPELVKDPSVLMQRFKDGLQSLENVKFTPKQIREGLQEPVQKDIAPDFFPNKSTELASDMQNLDVLARKGTDGRRLEGYRRSLSSTKDPLANRVREGVDAFMENADVSTGFRNNYRLVQKVGAVDDAIAKGGDNVSMARTALKNQLVGKNARGWTPHELEGGKVASRGDAREWAMRAGGALLRLPAAAGAIISGNPVAGGLLYGGGKGLSALADRRALKKIEDFRHLILNGGYMPTMSERFGTFVRGKLMK